MEGIYQASPPLSKVAADLSNSSIEILYHSSLKYQKKKKRKSYFLTYIRSRVFHLRSKEVCACFPVSKLLPNITSQDLSPTLILFTSVCLASFVFLCFPTLALISLLVQTINQITGAFKLLALLSNLIFLCISIIC